VRSLDPIDERLLGGPLQLGVEREPQREPLLEVVAVARPASRTAERVHAKACEPGATAQIPVVRSLDSALADVIPVPVAAALDLFGRHGPDVAEQLGGDRPVRIGAQVRLLDRHPGELLNPLLHIRDDVVVNTLGQRDGLQWVSPMLLAEGLLKLRHRDAENGAQPGEDARPCPARETGRPDADDVRKLVPDDRAAAIVVDRPPRRLDSNRAQLVVLSGCEIALAGEHLERPEAEEEHGEGEEDERSEHAQPQRDLRRHPVRGLDARIFGEEACPRWPDAADRGH
jgi:hypothetical protein